MKGKKTELSLNNQNDLYMRKVCSITKLYDKKPAAFIKTYGCQQNFADGEKLKGMLAEMGYEICDDEKLADLIIFNTCAIRENAENKVFGNVGELKKFKQKKPDLTIILCGCMVQQEHITERFVKKFPFIDIVFGTHVMHMLPMLLFNLLQFNEKQVLIPDSDGEIIEGLPVSRDSGIKAGIPIMYGCNNFCAYCIVPYVRGRERSREVSDVINEVKSLVNGGYKEITLLGQNVNSYKSGDYDFAALLLDLDKIDGEFVINYMTSHPKDCTEAFIDAVAACKKVSYHLHLPVQSGSNQILKLMNRCYTKERYIELVRYARKKIPEIQISTDIIVGFPGESYEDFLETLDLLKTLKIHSAFTFIYSKRENTKAALMPDNTAAEEKNKRFTELLSVLDEIGTAPYERFVGQIHRVLCEGGGRTDKRFMTGRNRHGIFVDFEGGEELIGKFVDVKIVNALNWALIGKII